jgi:mRNA interferase MazF
MKNIEHGYIFLINFNPSVGHEYQKVRPALIISSDQVLERSNLVTCIAITGNTDNLVEDDDIVVKKDAENRLFCDSVIKMHHIASFDKGRVKNYIGKMGHGVMKKVKEQLKVQFNI